MSKFTASFSKLPTGLPKEKLLAVGLCKCSTLHQVIQFGEIAQFISKLNKKRSKNLGHNNDLMMTLN
jgi:hypothetical protein